MKEKRPDYTQQLESDDEFPNFFDDISLLPAYLDDDRFEEVEFPWVDSFDLSSSDTHSITSIDLSNENDDSHDSGHDQDHDHDQDYDLDLEPDHDQDYDLDQEYDIDQEPDHDQDHDRDYDLDLEPDHGRYYDLDLEPDHRRHCDLDLESDNGRHYDLDLEPDHRRHCDLDLEPDHGRHYDLDLEPDHRRHCDLDVEPEHDQDDDHDQIEHHEKPFVKGILKGQDLYCLKSVEEMTSTSTMVWFVKFLMYKDLQCNYNYLKSCLVHDPISTSNQIFSTKSFNNQDEEPVPEERVEIVIQS